MSRIFISHSSVDNPKAAALRDWLIAHGWDDLFLDFDPEQGIAAGEQWQQALRDAADRCEAVICLISDAWLGSQWCHDEARMAWHLNKRIIGVLIEDLPMRRVPQWLVGEWQQVNLAAAGDQTTLATTVPPEGSPHTVSFRTEGLERLRLGLEKAALAAHSFRWPPDNDPNRAPYRGLVPLEAEDAGIFFGRHGQIVRALDQLRYLRQQGSGCLFVVQGASGSGKSSFLRAGLMPRLSRDDRHFLSLPVIRPERAVLTGESGLVAALDKFCSDHGLGVSRAELRREVQGGAPTVARRLTEFQATVRVVTMEGEAKPPPPTIILPIDQGEELFATVADGESRQFLRLLSELLEGRPHLIALVAIRSDSYRRLQEAPELEGKRQVPFSLPPVQRGAYQEIIEGPAAALPRSRRLDIAPALTERLLQDLEREGGADPLPLLAFTLERLYTDYGGGGRLEPAHYEALGELSGSISASVGAAVRDAQQKGTAPQQQPEVLKLLRGAFIPWLCEVDTATGVPQRRKAWREEIPADAMGLVDELVNHRLLVSSVDRDRDGKERPAVDIAHESLLRLWPLLRSWLRDDGDNLRLLNDLQQAAKDWHAQGCQEGWIVHHGERLLAVQKMMRMPRFADQVDRAGQDYLQACVKLQQENDERAEREAQAERRRLEAEAKAARRTRNAVIAVAFVALAAISTGIFAIYQTNVAEFQESKKLSRIAREKTERGDTSLGILLAREALPIKTFWGSLGGLDVPEAEAALLHAALAQRERHILNDGESEVNKIRFSPDGKFVVTASRDGVARIWNAETGELTNRLEGHKKQIYFAEFSEDGKHVVTASADGTARIWTIEDGRADQDAALKLGEHEGQVFHAAFSGDGKVVTVSGDGRARLWSVETGQLLSRIDAAEEGRWALHAAFSPDDKRVAVASADNKARLWNLDTGDVRGLEHEAQVVHAVFSPDGQILATASVDRTVRLWNGITGENINVLRGHGDTINQAIFSPDGKFIATASTDSFAVLWSVESGEVVKILKGHTAAVHEVQFSSDGRLLISSSGDGTVKFWDAASGEPVATLRGHMGAVWSTQFSSHGRLAASASEDGTARIWSVPSLNAQTPEDEGNRRVWGTTPQISSVALKGHTDSVNGSFFSPDGNTVVTVSSDSTARIWDAHAGELIWLLRGHRNIVWYAAFSKDGRHLVTTSYDGTAILWDVATGDPRHVLRGHTGLVAHAHFSPDGRLAATAGKEETAAGDEEAAGLRGTVRIWDVASGELRQILKGPQCSAGEEAPQCVMNFVEFLQGGRRIVGASGNGSVRLWDVETGEIIGEPFEEHEASINNGAFSQDKQRFATISSDKTAALWNVTRGGSLQFISQLADHTDILWSAAFSPNGRLLATASEDNTARLWNAADGKPLLLLEGHGASVNQVAFSRNGRLVLTASDDGTARLWHTKSGLPVAVLSGHSAAVVGAAFTPAPEGALIATASEDGTARIWKLPFDPGGSWLAFAESRLPRQELTDDERRSYLNRE